MGENHLSVAWPNNAREAGWIIADVGARWAFVTADVAPDRLAGLESPVALGPANAGALPAIVGDGAVRGRAIAMQMASSSVDAWESDSLCRFPCPLLTWGWLFHSCLAPDRIIP
jgi:hypothetical protein